MRTVIAGRRRRHMRATFRGQATDVGHNIESYRFRDVVTQWGRETLQQGFGAWLRRSRLMLPAFWFQAGESL